MNNLKMKTPSIFKLSSVVIFLMTSMHCGLVAQICTYQGISATYLDGQNGINIYFFKKEFSGFHQSIMWCVVPDDNHEYNVSFTKVYFLCNGLINKRKASIIVRDGKTLEGSSFSGDLDLGDDFFGDEIKCRPNLVISVDLENLIVEDITIKKQEEELARIRENELEQERLENEEREREDNERKEQEKEEMRIEEARIEKENLEKEALQEDNNPNTPTSEGKRAVDYRIEEFQPKEEEFARLTTEVPEAVGSWMTLDGNLKSFRKNKRSSFNMGLMVYGLNLPIIVNNAELPGSSTGGLYESNSETNTTVGLGLALDAQWWFYRSNNWGIGLHGNFASSFYAVDGSENQTYIPFIGLNFLGGTSVLKVFIEYDKIYRIADYKFDLDVFSGGSTNYGIVSEGSTEYNVNRFSAGIYLDFSDQDEENYLKIIYNLDKPSWLVKPQKWSHSVTLSLNYFFNIGIEYGKSYMIGGTAKYYMPPENRQDQNYFVVWFGKSFTIGK